MPNDASFQSYLKVVEIRKLTEGLCLRQDFGKRTRRMLGREPNFRRLSKRLIARFLMRPLTSACPENTSSFVKSINEIESRRPSYKRYHALLVVYSRRGTIVDFWL